MTKHLFAIFAHPDDEAFGPSGTLLSEVAAGTKIHLVTLTAGENGTNPDNHTNLAEVRLQEWRKAGALIGATSMHHFGYTDGALTNQHMLAIAEHIQQLVIHTMSPDDTVEFMTNDLNGITGHIDHIVAARAACLAFYRLKERYGSTMQRIRLTCITREQAPTSNTNWLYMEPGRRAEEIVETVDARHYREQIVSIMRAHHTQRSDGEPHIERRGDSLGINHFIVLE